MWPYLVVACCCAAPIFESTADNPWDELRQAFYSRRFTGGAIYEHDSALDGPPFTTWARFYNDEQFHKGVIEKLDRFLEQPAEKVEQQPAVRRAILLRDLWPIFDAQTELRSTYDPRAQEWRTMSEVESRRQTELLARIARIMRRLELSDEEAEQLPDNLTADQSPAKGFLPAKLFDETGPWVAIGQGKKVPGASSHSRGSIRSIFVPYIRVSADRQDTVDFLTQYRKSPLAPPPGSSLALARRMVLPTSSGRLIATPIVESLQLMVVAPPQDHRYKFVLDRAELIAGRPGLRMLAASDPVDAYAFEASGLMPIETKYDSDGEMLVLGRLAGPTTESSLGHCTACHGRTMGARLFANGNGADFLVMPTTWHEQAELVLSLGEKEKTWKAYQQLRE